MLTQLRKLTQALEWWPLLALLLSLSVPATVSAQSTLYPNVWRRGQNLPAGQSLFTFSSNFSSFSNKLGEDGSSVGMGDAYTQTVTWGELLADQNQTSHQQLRQYVQSKGVSLDAVAATATMDISQDVLNFSPQWAYGLTSNWMVGVRLPLMYRQTVINSKVTMSDEYTSMAEQADPGTQARLNSESPKARVQQAINRKLSEGNYEPLKTNEREWLLGDVELLSKIKIWQTANMLWALRERVVLPTASGKSPYRFVDATEGDGQLDLGLDSIVDYWLGSGWLVSGSLGYTWQTRDQIKARLPGSPLAANDDINLEVNRDLGDYWTASGFVEKSLFRQWRLFTGYSYFNKQEDTYDGTPEYRALSEGSKQELHLGHLGFSYKADPISQRFGLKTQLATSVYYSRILAGSNVPDASTAGLDLQLLF